MGYILVTHWVADFILQSDEMAKNKSKHFRWLIAHVAVYTLTMCVFGIKFALVNGTTHLAIDFVTSRISSFMWENGRTHDFFVVIGLDQLLHTLILLSTAHLVDKTLFGLWG